MLAPTGYIVVTIDNVRYAIPATPLDPSAIRDRRRELLRRAMRSLEKRGKIRFEGNHVVIVEGEQNV